MSEMVERVASRIQEALMVIANGESDSPVYEHIARAAIGAMREPTEGMKCDGDTRPWDWLCQTCGGPKEHWYRMINEALR
jgi:hypothetical protein